MATVRRTARGLAGRQERRRKKGLGGGKKDGEKRKGSRDLLKNVCEWRKRSDGETGTCAPRSDGCVNHGMNGKSALSHDDTPAHHFSLTLSMLTGN